MSRKRLTVAPLFGILLSLAVLEPVHGQQSDSVNWTAVGNALGRSGTMMPGAVYRVGLPRTDLKLSVGTVVVRPALALGSWAGFHQTGPGQVIAMGDLVLLESELPAVAPKLEAGGIMITAIHQHLLHESPAVVYLHFHAAGNAVEIATALHSALLLTGTPLSPAAAAAAPDPLTLDTAAIVRALGRSGKLNGGVYQVGVPRRETIQDDGITIPPTLGVATAINFQSVDGASAATTGDFVLLGGEVQRVIKALQKGGIEVTALHSHMLDESPRLYFMHFWGVGDVSALAGTLRAALDQTGSAPP